MLRSAPPARTGENTYSQSQWTLLAIYKIYTLCYMFIICSVSGFLSFNILFLRFIHVYVVMNHLSPLLCSIHLCAYIIIYLLLIDICVFTFWLLGLVLLQTFLFTSLADTYAFPLSIYVSMEFLGHRVYRCFPLLDTANSISKRLIYTQQQYMSSSYFTSSHTVYSFSFNLVILMAMNC